jgi:hypothetical protein
MRVAVVDVGSPANLGWAMDNPDREGDDLDGAVRAIAQALSDGPVALGFEAPQFTPLRDDQRVLTRARAGEGSRPFSAGAGASVLVTSLVVVPYVLANLRREVADASVTFDWTRLPSHQGQLLLWEAFVSNQSNKEVGRHVQDAKRAVSDFRERMRNPASLQSDVTAPQSFNLLGAALLRTGWSTDLSLLSAPCLVVRSS